MSDKIDVLAAHQANHFLAAKKRHCISHACGNAAAGLFVARDERADEVEGLEVALPDR